MMKLQMDIKKQIKSLLKEAELYRTHGLLEDSKRKYSDAVELIRKNKQLKNRENLINSVLKKISDLGQDIDRMEKGSVSQEISTRDQDLIKKLFSFSKEKDSYTAAVEGAKTLLEFGQFERALREFNELIKKDSLRVVAAKNILRCRIAISSLDDAVAQYQQWLSSDLFSPEQLNKVRLFLEGIIEEKGIDKLLPEEPEVDKDLEIKETEFLDISSIGITLDKGPQKGKEIELDVNYQTGNIISLIIPKNYKALIESLKVGLRLDNVQFYSPIAMFKGSAIVWDKRQIDSGPKKGDYGLDMKIASV